MLFDVSLNQLGNLLLKLHDCEQQTKLQSLLKHHAKTPCARNTGTGMADKAVTSCTEKLHIFGSLIRPFTFLCIPLFMSFLSCCLSCLLECLSSYSTFLTCFQVWTVMVLYR